MSKSSTNPTNAIFGIVQTAYNSTIRDHLPRTWWGVYDGIPARDVRLLDFTHTVDPYKPGLKRAINEYINEDAVVLVGGGRGISSVWLSRRGASVIAYEASREMIDIARETLEKQGCKDAVEFRHALVGKAVDVYGPYADATTVPPSELQTHDALVMDCEGAEESILRGLEDLPPTLIVETHPERGVPTAATKPLLAGRGYDITTLDYSPDKPDKDVLVGTLEE